jgi:phosphoribosylformimino-5-aminoimidazole carboxamide ribonucleotide (ProFAR) isomerase
VATTGIVAPVAFEILPAIDVSEGRLAVYGADGPRPLEAFEGDPVAAAVALARVGARWLHVVDMDRAFGREPTAVEVLAGIRAAVPGVLIQSSGGIRTEADVQEALRGGAARVVLSSAALADEAAAERLAARYGTELVVGLEVEGGRIRSRGADPVELDLMPTVGWLTAAGAGSFLVTAVARVGALTGPDLETIRRVARRGVPTMAAGGIASIEDLEAVRAAGAIGAVVGRAAIDGDLDLGAAFEAFGA